MTRTTGTAPGGGPALVAVAHGSRDPRARATVTALLTRVRALRPWLDVRLGHIELDAPLIDATLADLGGGPGGPGGLGAPRGPGGRGDLEEPLIGATPAGLRGDLGGPGDPDTLRGPGGSGDAVLVPLLLSRGHHVKHDLPRALAGAPHLRGTVADPLGPHPLLAEALAARLAEAVRPGGGRGSGYRSGSGYGDAVVLAAAGSRDPDSARDTRRTAALLSARLGGVPVLPGYVSAVSPTVPEAVARLAARGARRIAVASCFTAPGLFAERAAADAPWLVSAPLGAHDAMVRLLLHRYDQARLRAFGAPRRDAALPTPA